MQKEVDAADKLDVEYVNVHLGAHTGAGVEGGLDNAASALDELDIPDGVTVLVESDAGSGTKLGGEFEHLAEVLDRSSQDLEICVDTAPRLRRGLRPLDGRGASTRPSRSSTRSSAWTNSRASTSTTPKHDCGTNKDEHAHVGEGEIGVEGMQTILTHEALADVPFVLETPTEDGKSFEWNIERARELAGQETK